MKKKEVKKGLNKLWKEMKKPVKSFIKSGDQEELHQFRVQVKKLKAILVLFSAESKNQHLLKDFKPVKTVFKKAGEIRNAHINLKLAEKYNLDDADFKNQQQKMLEEGTESFKNKGKKKLKQFKKAQLILLQNLHRVKNKTIRHFYQEKLKLIDAFFINLVFNDELHNARKNIKLLLYNRKPAASAIYHKIDLKDDYLDDLQNDIGEWHDHNLAIETLAGTGKDEFKAITDLKNSNAELEEAIADKSSNFMAKVNPIEIVSA